MLRTHTCGELTAQHIGETVTLSWRVNKARDLWGLTFVDLRDRYGITQITVDPQRNDQWVIDTAQSLKNEYVIQVKWEVVARPATMINKEMITGKIEINVTSLEILTKADVLPFPIVDDPKTNEEQRFTYRYLDLRRDPILRNMKFRAKMNHFTRNWFTEGGFLEIQTPLFTVSSPEWARDFLVPSRINPGEFYALPQAPQQYKQLLMVGWIDKYFQIAPCFRDEDPRADRHMCEFYQIDCEMSFVEQEDVYHVVESFCKDLTKEMVPDKTIVWNFTRLSFNDAMDRYGSDKPDLRFGMKFIDVTSVFASSWFWVFKNTVTNGWAIKCIKLEWQEMSRKDIDELTEVAKQAGAKWLAYVKYTNEWPQSPIVKFFADEELTALREATDVREWDILFFISDDYDVVVKSLNKVRLFLRDKFDLANKDELAFVWVEDFPFFEEDDDGNLEFAHNPFSYIKWWAEALATKKPMELETTQYDLTLNGYEILSWSIRNHDPDVMLKAFEKAGLGEAEIKERFGGMYKAFHYGAPPHGWFAFGFDRFMMILLDQENIRDIYAFPKSGRAQDVMMGAPSTIDAVQLDELHIEVKKTEEG